VDERGLRSRLADDHSLSQYGMCVAMRAMEGGGLVTGLPVHNFYTDEGDVAMKCPTEMTNTDRAKRNWRTLASSRLVAL